MKSDADLDSASQRVTCESYGRVATAKTRT